MSSKNDWVISSANRSIRSGLVELYEARAILFALIKRELKSRYRGSFFGFTWALGRPLVTLLIFYFVIGQILGASRSIEDFAIYLFVGMMFWNMFAESVIVGTSSLIRNSGLIQKVAFPREILPLSTVILAGINTIVQLPILFFGYLLTAQWPDLSKLLLLVPVVTSLFFMCLSLALILSALNVYVRDIQPLTELSISLLMYATPILYSWTFVHDAVLERFNDLKIFDLYMSNPLAIIITGIQDSLWPGTRIFKDGNDAGIFYSQTSAQIWLLLILSVFTTGIAYRIFLKLEPNFAREL